MSEASASNPFFADPTPPRNFEIRPRPPSLPKTYEEMVAGKLVKTGKNLNDHVDDIHNLLWNETDADPSYQELIDAVYDEDAVEGSTIFDDYVLAKMIIAKAAKMGNTYISNKKPATIAKAHRTVLRRYGLNRKQRREMVKGEVMSGANGNDG